MVLWMAAAFGDAKAQTAGAPVIFEGGVVNAASFLRPPLAGSGLAQGSLISIFGSNLGPDPAVSGEFPLAAELAGVSVGIQTAAGGVLAALPLFVSAGQVNALLPSSTPIGMNQISVRRDGVASGAVAIQVVRSSFGLFASGSEVVRTAVAQRFVSETDLPVATREAPTRPGETVVLWGTGLGPVTAPETAPSESILLETPIEVLVGHHSATIRYQGRASCCVGLDQINIEIPKDAPVGCLVPVWVSVRGALYSNITTIPISGDGGACADNPNLPTAAPGGTAGRILLRRTVKLDETLQPGQDATSDGALGWFGAPGEAATSAGPAPLGPAGLPMLPPQGTCLVYGPGAEGEGAVRDAGTRLDLETPGGQVAVPLATQEYRLAAPPAPLFLGPGSYRLQGTGGSGFPPFSSQIVVGQPAEWQTKEDAEGEARLRGVPIAWNSAAATLDGILAVGRDVVPSAPGGDSETLAPTRFLCALPRDAQEFVIPPAVLANLPEAAAGLELASVWGPQPLELPTDGPETGSLAYLHVEQSSVRLGQARLPSTPVTLPDGSEVEAELAATFSERQRGLMFRRELPAGQGMLFLFENPGQYGFWMLNTLVPLDIVWLDSEHRVVFISENTPPCPAGTFCPTYGSEATAQFVLELAAGEAAAHRVRVGAQVEW
jgi:uncharacterized protein (TIGR03437 family)